MVGGFAKRISLDRSPHLKVEMWGIQAWASHKSSRAKNGSNDGDGSNFRGQKRSNDTHESTTHGARAAVVRMKRERASFGSWLNGLEQRAPRAENCSEFTIA